MPNDVKTRFIVRAAMTEYMILMFGALVIYWAVQTWPKATYPIALVGGVSVAVVCVVNFCLVYRTSSLTSSPLSPGETGRPPREP